MRPLLAEAEVFAWPLADTAAFRAGDTSMPSAARPPSGLVERLARHPGHTAPTLLCRKTWGPARTIPELLRSTVGALLEPAGAAARLVVDDDEPGRELLRWRALSLLVPHACLLAWVPGAPARVALLDRALAPPGPLADLHLHLTAAGRFVHVWEALAAEHRRRPLRMGLSGPDGSAWERALDAALWLRGLFDPGHSPILQTVALRQEPVTAALLRGDFFQPLPPGHLPVTARGGELARRREAALREDLRVRVKARSGPQPPCDPPRRSPGQPARGPNQPVQEGRPEPVVQAHMWRWAAARGSLGDADAEALVVQYLRVQTALFRRLVMDPTARGLAAFRETFDHIHELSLLHPPRLSRSLAEDAAAVEVGAIEVRVAPPRSGAELDAHVTAVRAVAQAAPRGRVEHGLVVHFIRTPPKDAPLAELSRRSAARAEQLACLLDLHPDLLHHVRGLDLAGDEQAGPLWVMAAPLQRVLDAATEASARTAHRPPNGRVPPPRLGVTLHAGEDFDHLLTGLRAVAEVLERKLVRRGDRIGHALAVLTDAGPWVESHRRVVVRKVDRLLDLCWVISEARKAGWPLPPGALAAWEEERDELGHSLFPPSEAGRRASRGARSSGREAHPHRPGAGTPGGWCADAARGVLRAWRNPHLARSLLSGPPPEEPGPQLFYRWLHHRSDPKGPADPLLDEVVEVGAEPAPGALAAIQQVLRQRLARAQICVESNPTSNLLIGALHGPVDLPGLAPLTVDDDPGAIPVAFAADDPLSFETSLADEYAYAWAGFVTLGRLTPERARERLAQAAAASWRFRFTLPRG